MKELGDNIDIGGAKNANFGLQVRAHRGGDGLTVAELHLATKQTVQNATVDTEHAVVTANVLEDALRRVTDDLLALHEFTHPQLYPY